jgi:uncharacterized protein (DUF1015 family)
MANKVQIQSYSDKFYHQESLTSPIPTKTTIEVFDNKEIIPPKSTSLFEPAPISNRE